MQGTQRNVVRHITATKSMSRPTRNQKLVELYTTTDASVHTPNLTKPPIEGNDKGRTLYLDAGYEAREDIVRECGMEPVICEKGLGTIRLPKNRNRTTV